MAGDDVRAGPDGRAGASPDRSPWAVLTTVMVGTLLIGLDRTIINLAIPDVIKDFDITVSTAGWLATAYIISNAVFVPVFGKLGDMIGDRRVYTAGMFGFLVTSLLCGLAPNFGTLVVFRVLQGLIGAAVFPTGLSLITRTFTDRKAQTQAFGIWTSAFAASFVIGPLVGGPLIDAFSWRWIFFINFPICLVGIAMSRRLLPRDPQSGRLHAFDWEGSVLLGVALAALVLVLERGRDWGWTSPVSLAAYVTVVVFAVWFVQWERRTDDPVIDLRLARNRVLVNSLVVTFISFSAMMGSMFLLPNFAQTYLGYSATKTGLLLLPMALTMMIVSPLSSRLTTRFPARFSITIGMAIAAVAMYLLHGLDVRTTALELTFPMVLLAFGLALGFAPLTAAATTSVPSREAGMASGILNLTRNVAGAMGIALFGTLLDNTIENRVLDIGGATVIRAPAPDMGAMIPQLIVVKAQIEAYGHVFAAAAAVMLLCAFVALTVRLGARRPTQLEAAEAASAA